ncbi:MAG: hypothetical protein U5J62_06235 [Desulfurivibrio sp.]|nr:hypothetical protein [Desulfurivibrio sp.]
MPGQTNELTVDLAINKVIQREETRLQEIKATLRDQLGEFEKKYGMPTDAFRNRFQQGELGDGIDYIEWDATAEMLANAEKHLNVLLDGSNDESAN